MFSARPPHARLIVACLILIGGLLRALPVSAQQHGNAPVSVQQHGNAPVSAQQHGNAPVSAQQHGNAPTSPQKVPSATAASLPSVTTVSAPTADAGPLEMTRDAGPSDRGSLDPHSPVGDAGRLNPVGQIARMIGALAIVLLLILGGAHFVRRSPLVAQVPGSAPTPRDLSFPGTLKAGFSFLSPLAALQPLKRAGAQLRAVPPTPLVPGQPPSLAPLEPGLLRLAGAQILPGSAASVYLVQIGTKGFLLGASADGPIQLLSEIAGLEAVASAPIAEAAQNQDEDEAFEAMLREQMTPVPEREEARLVQSVVERLNQTHERLSRRLSDGASSSQDRLNV